jgi:hypothetical protein
MAVRFSPCKARLIIDNVGLPNHPDDGGTVFALDYKREGSNEKKNHLWCAGYQQGKKCP